VHFAQFVVSLPLPLHRKLKIYEEQELTMKIFAEPSEFQLPIAENSSIRQQHSITQNLLGMETPPTPLIDTYGGSDAGGDFDTNYATILNYSNNNNNNNNSNSSSSNHHNNSALANNSRNTNNALIDADYQTLRNAPRVPPVSTTRMHPHC
jgi:hypothetical protein